MPRVVVVSKPKTLVYLAHPVSSRRLHHADAVAEVLENCHRAKTILAYLIEQHAGSEYVISAPWIAEVEARIDVATGRDAAIYKDAIERCLATVERFDEIWLTGPRVTQGMAKESTHMRRMARVVKNMTDIDWRSLVGETWK